MKSIRVALTSVFAATALLASAVAAIAAPGQATTNVNVRSGPDGSYGVVGTMRSGEMADVSQCGNGWCYVQSRTVSGWVSSAYLAQPGAADQPQDPSLNFGLTIDGNGKPSVNIGVNQPAPRPNTPPPPPQPQYPQPPRPQYPGPNHPGPHYPGPNPQVPRPPQPPLPDDDDAQACFYSGTNFTGRSFCVDQGDTLNYLRPDWNDRIRSVELTGGATVDICSERNQVGLCQTLTRSKSRLSPQIDRNISSVDVY